MYARAHTNSFSMVSICNRLLLKILVDEKLGGGGGGGGYITVDPLEPGKQKEQFHSSRCLFFLKFFTAKVEVPCYGK